MSVHVSLIFDPTDPEQVRRALLNIDTAREKDRQEMFSRTTELMQRVFLLETALKIVLGKTGLSVGVDELIAGIAETDAGNPENRAALAKAAEKTCKLINP